MTDAPRVTFMRVLVIEQVLMATNRPDTLDPALIRPGRLDRKVEFGLPDLAGRAHIFKIHAKSMNCDRYVPHWFSPGTTLDAMLQRHSL